MIARAVRSWVERLGAVWVEAQLIEINRRSGTRTIFLTLRDKLAEVSVSVTTSPTTLDSAGPLTEGATVEYEAAEGPKGPQATNVVEVRG